LSEERNNLRFGARLKPIERINQTYNIAECEHRTNELIISVNGARDARFFIKAIVALICGNIQKFDRSQDRELLSPRRTSGKLVAHSR
jgi:hypothetical protein